MATYRTRKTATVDAVRFTGDNFDEIRAFLGDNAGAWFVRAGCWIVREPNGECYSCDDDVFSSIFVAHDIFGSTCEVLAELGAMLNEDELHNEALISVADRIVALLLEGAAPQPIVAG